MNMTEEGAEAVDSREIIRRLKQDGWFENGACWES